MIGLRIGPGFLFGDTLFDLLDLLAGFFVGVGLFLGGERLAVLLYSAGHPIAFVEGKLNGFGFFFAKHSVLREFALDDLLRERIGVEHCLDLIFVGLQVLQKHWNIGQRLAG